VLFNSYIFLFGFLPSVLVGCWALRNKNLRLAFLTVSSWFFYAWWDWRFLPLMLSTTTVDYIGALLIDRTDDERRRRLLLAVSLGTNLSLLGYFKYAGFFLDSLDGMGSTLGLGTPFPELHIVLPIGISFYTFHTISYIVDSYRGVIRPTRNLWEFGTYVSLFSQLIAGPIVRFRQIEEDLEALGHADRTRWLGRGISFFIVGLVEKVLVADSIAAFVDPALAHWQLLSTLGAWMAMLGYSFQLYFDFAGYSTMAVGLGYMFGLRIPQNFDSPYKSLDPSEFWRRWHISLSTVLRDYLYIPLGGNRHGEWKAYRNLMITMLLGGLWHGASWVFVLWGAYHGVLLALYRAGARWWDPLPARLRQAGMFLIAVIGWVFFRSTSFTMATGLLGRMFSPATGTLVPQPELAALALLGAAWWAMIGPNAFDMKHEYGLPGRAVQTAAFAASLAIILGSRVTPFLYFQF
jgi:alginate O-acetyltransferase complex protein AlgI